MIERLRRVALRGYPSRPTQHLGEAQTCCLVSEVTEFPEFAGHGGFPTPLLAFGMAPCAEEHAAHGFIKYDSMALAAGVRHNYAILWTWTPSTSSVVGRR